MRKGKALNNRFIALAVVISALWLVSIACASAAPTSAPVAPQQPAAPVAPTAAPAAPTAAPIQGAPTAVPPTAIPTRVLPTATPVVTSQISYGGVLRHARPLADIDSLDGHLNTRYDGLIAMYAIYNNIVQLTPEGTVGPDLAQSWQVSADGKSIAFKLQSGVKFQDGTSLNAQAVKWNIDRILNPDVGSSQRAIIGPFIQDVKVIDNDNFVINLKDAFRPFLATLAERSGFVLSPTAVDKLGTGFLRKPVGTGPFKVTEWVPKGDIILEKFDGYWEKGKPYLNGIRFQEAGDGDVRLAMIRTGETDVIDDVEPTQIPLVEKDPKVRVVPIESGRTWGFETVMVVPPYDNKNLRQAIAYATDRKSFKDIFYEGRARIAYVPSTMGWEYNANLKPLDFDLAAAKAKLTEAGYPNGIDLDITCMATGLEIKRCEFYQAMLGKVNIRLSIKPIPVSDFWISFYATYPGKRNTFGMYWYNPRGDPYQSLQRVFHSKGASNQRQNTNPEVDKLIDQSATIYDVAKAKPLYDQINKMIAEDAGMIFTSNPTVYAVTSSKVKNFVWIPDLFLRTRDLSIEK